MIADDFLFVVFTVSVTVVRDLSTLRYRIAVRYGWILGKSTVRNYVRYFRVNYGTVRKYGIIFSVPYPTNFRT